MEASGNAAMWDAIQSMRRRGADLRHRGVRAGKRSFPIAVRGERRGQGSKGKTRRQSFLILTTSQPFFVAVVINESLKVPTFVSAP